MKAKEHKRPFLLLYINEFIGSPVVQAMNDSQVRWYLWLLMRAWQNEPACCLPNDDAQLMMYAGCKSKKLWDANKGLVLSCWEPDESGKFVSNARLIAEYNRMCAINEKRKEAGKKSAASKQQNSTSVEHKPATETLTETKTVTKPKGKPLSAEADDVTDDQVDMIRLAHPRGAEDAADGRKAILKAIGRESKVHGSRKDAARHLYKRAIVYGQKVAEWPPGENPKFVKMCATWFNKESYNSPDESYERKSNGKAEQRNSEIENAGAEARRILGLRDGNLQVLPGGARSDSTLAGRSGVGEVGENHRVIEGSVRSVPLKPEVRLPPEAGETD